MHGDTTAKCSILYHKFALPSLRLTFGGSPFPNEFCLFSEMCLTVSSPHATKIPEPILQSADIEFQQAKSIDVNIPLDTWGKVDDFIDDGIVIVPDLQNNRNRAIQAMLLAIHILCCPLAPNEPIS